MVGARSFRLIVVLAFFAVCFTHVAARAENIRVGVTGGSPFVISQEGVLSGLSVDIWRNVADLNGWQYSTKVYADADQTLEALKNNEVDIVVADIPITSAGLKYVEYSQPYFRSGLQIMITDARPHTMARLLEYLENWGHLTIFWWLLGVVVLLTFLVTLFERRHNPDFPKTWPAGVAEAAYYVISLALTGKSVYKGFPGVLGRLMLIFWMIVGVITVAFLTSSITTAMTVEKLQGHINGPQDLPGKVVAAVHDTQAVQYLSRHSVETEIFPTLEEAVDALVQGKVQAVVGAAPLLQYYDASHPTVPITEVNPVFGPYNYGYAMPVGSTLRQPVNAALLKLQESGALLDLCRKYFGAVYQP